MKSLFAVACLLAATAVVRGEENIIERYLTYLQPSITPCMEKFQLNEEEIHNVQKVATMSADGLERLACLRACVLKDMGAMDGQLELVIAPIYKMIETVHENKPDEITEVKTIANECIDNMKGETMECQRASKYAECYIARLMQMKQFD